MVFYGESSAKPGGIRGAWSHIAVIFKYSPDKKLTRHDKSDSHIDAIKKCYESKNQACIWKKKQGKNKANELSVEKLSGIMHLLACNNLPVKELYPKMIRFLSGEINEPVITQYLETCPRNAAHNSSDSCDSIMVIIKKSPYQLLLCCWFSYFCWVSNISS